MGASSNNPFKSGHLLSDYTVTGKNQQMFTTYLTHKHTGKQYLLRQLTFTEQQQLIINHQRIKIRKSLINEHLTLIQRSQQTTEDNMCSHYFKIYTLWHYPNKTLSQQIKERDLQKKAFQDKQIWSILACSIMGLASLQQKDIKHECLTTKSILMDEGNVKIADPMAAGLQTNFEVIFNNRTLKHIYLSPEQCEAIQSQKPIIGKNSYKNDVFTMGIILLECGLLERQDQCYLEDCSRINWSKLQANLHRFGHIYQPDLIKLLSLMLEKDIRHRPDWLQLNNFVGNRRNEVKNGRSMLKRDHYITRTVKSNFSKRQNKDDIICQSSKFYGNPAQPNTDNKIQTSEVKRIVPSFTNRPGNQPVNNYASSSNNYTSNGNYSPSYYNTMGHSSDLKIINSDAHLPPYRSTSPQPLRSNFVPSLQLNNNSNRPYTSTDKTDAGTFNFPTFRFNNEPSPSPLFDRKTAISPVKSYEPTVSYQSQFEQLGKVTESNIHNNSHILSLDKQKSGTNQNSYSPPNINQYVRPTQSINYEIFKYQSPVFQQNESVNLQSLKIANTSKIPVATSKEQPEYVVEHFKVGSRYEGYKLNGMREGTGKFYYQDGGYYDGEWSRNKMEGQGILYYQSNHKAYEGQWLNDQFNGHGILYNDNPIPFNENFDFNNFDDIDQYWEFYQGNFDKDEKDGQGRLKFSNGEVFQGTFKKDMVEGEGIFTCLDGRSIRGIWRENHLVTMLD